LLRLKCGELGLYYDDIYCFWSGRLLVEADQVPGGVAEPGRDLRRVDPDRLHDLASVSADGVKGLGHAIHHDVKQKAGIRRGGAAEHSGAACFPSGVVKCSSDIPAFPHIPAEYLSRGLRF